MDYHAFTRELTDRLADDRRVIGLVSVGSMAAIDYQPDAWSDHDFLVIAPPGEQEALRADLSWLPSSDRIELSFRETEHGLKVVYDDGHLVEFAVFDLDELRVACINRYRVLLDGGGVEERMREVAALSRESQPDDFLFGMFVSGIQVSCGRAARGERISGRFFAVSGTRSLCTLLARELPAENARVLDSFDPLRRFERAYPELGAEIDRALRDDPAALLDLAERELRARRPDLPWAALAAVRQRLAG